MKTHQRPHHHLSFMVVQVFDVRTGSLLRTFQGAPNEFMVGKDGADPGEMFHIGSVSETFVFSVQCHRI